ncbi:MAG: hypothetical protein CEE43_01710 [Promethearchaeota archaeon Loki_b32]|nr:MAG: hypothetical protein CEE43_01710 [Candidatus Lokiarchaeota archaeon Loki_b32]
MSDSFNFKKLRKNENLELTNKDREDLIKTLIKSYENYEKTLFETNKRIRKVKLELKENINK